MELNQVSSLIIESAIDVHRALGPGLLESVYEKVLAHELVEKGLEVDVQVAVPIRYKAMEIADAFRMDLFVAQSVIVELKSLERVQPVHKKQLLTYLRLTNLKLGLLINFGEEVLRTGITRLVNTFPEQPSVPSASSARDRI